MKTRSTSRDSWSSFSSDDLDHQNEMKVLESELMQAAASILEGKTQNVVSLLLRFMRQIESSLLQRLARERQQRQESVGQVEDSLNTWLSKGAEQQKPTPKVAVPKSTPHFAKPCMPAPQIQSATSSVQQLPSTDGYAFEKQVTPGAQMFIEPHIQTCPQPQLQPAAQRSTESVRFALPSSTNPLPSSISTNPPKAALSGRPAYSSQTMSQLPLWLRPRSNDLREYEKRAAVPTQTPQGSEHKCTESGTCSRTAQVHSNCASPEICQIDAAVLPLSRSHGSSHEQHIQVYVSASLTLPSLPPFANR